MQAIDIIHDVYTMHKNKWGVMVNTCKEFHLLPLSKGYASIRDFATPSVFQMIFSVDLDIKFLMIKIRHSVRDGSSPYKVAKSFMEA